MPTYDDVLLILDMDEPSPDNEYLKIITEDIAVENILYDIATLPFKVINYILGLFSKMGMYILGLFETETDPRIDELRRKAIDNFARANEKREEMDKYKQIMKVLTEPLFVPIPIGQEPSKLDSNIKKIIEKFKGLKKDIIRSIKKSEEEYVRVLRQVNLNDVITTFKLDDPYDLEISDEYLAKGVALAIGDNNNERDDIYGRRKIIIDINNIVTITRHEQLMSECESFVMGINSALKSIEKNPRLKKVRTTGGHSEKIIDNINKITGMYKVHLEKWFKITTEMNRYMLYLHTGTKKYADTVKALQNISDKYDQLKRER